MAPKQVVMDRLQRLLDGEHIDQVQWPFWVLLRPSLLLQELPCQCTLSGSFYEPIATGTLLSSVHLVHVLKGLSPDHINDESLVYEIGFHSDQAPRSVRFQMRVEALQ